MRGPAHIATLRALQVVEAFPWAGTHRDSESFESDGKLFLGPAHIAPLRAFTTFSRHFQSSLVTPLGSRHQPRALIARVGCRQVLMDVSFTVAPREKVVSGSAALSLCTY